jgi:hypothetical protein
LHQPVDPGFGFRNPLGQHVSGSARDLELPVDDHVADGAGNVVSPTLLGLRPLSEEKRQVAIPKKNAKQTGIRYNRLATRMLSSITCLLGTVPGLEWNCNQRAIILVNLGESLYITVS